MVVHLTKQTEEQKIEILIRWFLENGGELSEAYGLSDFPLTGRGVMALRFEFLHRFFYSGFPAGSRYTCGTDIDWIYRLF